MNEYTNSYSAYYTESSKVLADRNEVKFIANVVIDNDKVHSSMGRLLLLSQNHKVLSPANGNSGTWHS